jgi:hypothetical protein
MEFFFFLVNAVLGSVSGYIMCKTLVGKSILPISG